MTLPHNPAFGLTILLKSNYNPLMMEAFEKPKQRVFDPDAGRLFTKRTAHFHGPFNGLHSSSVTSLFRHQ
jgi:hypothetical protein